MKSIFITAIIAFVSSTSAYADGTICPSKGYVADNLQINYIKQNWGGSDQLRIGVVTSNGHQSEMFSSYYTNTDAGKATLSLVLSAYQSQVPVSLYCDSNNNFGSIIFGIVN
ncbi:hypothetical protein FHS76_000290 [Ochrobactrum daejeonense]|uniref:Uncharacterized protein n=1 Tax=Brucella daejeonensis TaxID=659015 RepID=A0A7W9EJP5_9HYPH|nr:hypothetical protein [Brucella daejeonensis]MBB5700452.1 hypothetical protein [Brucella daejeonensis]